MSLTVPIDIILIGQVHLYLICEILFILFSVIELDLMCISVKGRAHQGYDTFVERHIRTNIVPNGTDMNIFPLIRTIDIINSTTRHNNMF
jgi:hypothetical protein